ncbi:MAG: hypothetical protein LAQ30_31515 [Acidobacteriia bacterium]|nr:hypothetical protein [Terriglobia bacterium]
MMPGDGRRRGGKRNLVIGVLACVVPGIIWVLLNGSPGALLSFLVKTVFAVALFELAYLRIKGTLPPSN